MINKILKKFGLLLVTEKYIKNIYNPKIEEISHFDEKNILKFREYSAVSFVNLYSLISALKFIKNNNVQGDLIECGVYKGGCAMLLSAYNNYYDLNRDVYAYDTYEGMKPQKNDIDKRFDGTLAYSIWKNNNKSWLECSLKDVKTNFIKANIDMKKTIFIKGKIEHTLKKKLPKSVSLLRLDLDLYEPTMIALEAFFHLMPSKSIIYIDDYNHWKGCRLAVDKFFKNKNIYSHYVDPACKLYIKI